LRNRIAATFLWKRSWDDLSRSFNASEMRHLVTHRLRGRGTVQMTKTIGKEREREREGVTRIR